MFTITFLNSALCFKFFIRKWGRVGQLDEGSQNVQTSSYKINKYLGCNVQHDDCS